MSKSRDIADSAATINYIDGLTSDAQTQLDAKAVYPDQTGNSGKFLTTDGSVTSWGEAGGGATVQIVYVETTALATGTTTTPADNTIPQNTEGDQYLTATITPTDASNYLVIEAVFQCYPELGASRLAMALFVDSATDAIATVFQRPSGSYESNVLVMRKRIAAGSTSSRTYKIRIGASSGATHVNQFNGAQIYGGSEVSSITISEVTP